MFDFHTESKFVVIGVHSFPNVALECDTVLHNQFYHTNYDLPLKSTQFKFRTPSGHIIHSANVPRLAKNIFHGRSNFLGILDIQLKNNTLSGEPNIEGQFDPSFRGSVTFANKASFSNRLTDALVEPEGKGNVWSLDEEFEFKHGPLQVSTGKTHHSVDNSQQLLKIVSEVQHIEKFEPYIMIHVGFYLVRASIIKPRDNGVLKLNFN